MDKLRASIGQALKEGTLQVETVCPKSGTVSWQPVSAVLRHDVSNQDMFRLTTVSGRQVVLTGDHSLFRPTSTGVEAVRTADLNLGDEIVVVHAGRWFGDRVSEVLPLEGVNYAYDLSVPGPENFVLSSGILAHNSYSIGGISLDLNKAAEYQSLKDTADQMFDKATTAKQQTVFVVRGLRQPRYAAGISTVGPYVSRGVTMHPRNFMGAA